MTASPTLAAAGERRFAASARLLGADGLARLARAHVVVVGLGGVGSWAAEGLARTGCLRLTLIDLDQVGESNVNRQVHALESTIGAAKVDVMAARIAQISPQARVAAIDAFVTPANVADLVPPDADVVIDATDQVAAKAALVAHCVARQLTVVVCGSAGGRRDPLRLRRADLAEATGDALLAALRSRLRREHGFPAAPGGARRPPPMGVTVVHSTETADEPGTGFAGVDTAGAGAPLACAGYGSLVAVTATMGFAAAQIAIAAIVERHDRTTPPPAPRREEAS